MVIFANALATDPVLGAIVTALVQSNARTVTPLPADRPGPQSDTPGPPVIPHRMRHHRQCIVGDSDDDERFEYPEPGTEWKEYGDLGFSTHAEDTRGKKGKQRQQQDRQASATSSFPDDELDDLIANLTILDDHGEWGHYSAAPSSAK